MDKDTALDTLFSGQSQMIDGLKVVLSFKNAEEIADFIEQQAKIIEALKNCGNCKYKDEIRYEKPCCDCSYLSGSEQLWKWDGEE